MPFQKNLTFALRMKGIRFIGLFIFLPAILQAFTLSLSDSLLRALDSAHGKEKIALLIKLSEQNRDKSVYDCKKYNKEAFQLSQKEGYSNMMGLASKSMGVSYFYWGDMKKAFDYFKTGLHYYKNSGDKEGQSNCLNNIGLVYESWAIFDSAAYYYQASYNIEKELKNVEGAATSLINMGNIDYYRKNYQGALNNYFHALQNFTTKNDCQGMAMAYNSLSIIYTQMGNFSTALDYLRKAKNIYTSTGNNLRLSRVLNNMADIYNDHFKEYKKAEILYEKVLKIKEEQGLKAGVALVKSNIGVLYGHMGNLSQSLKYFDESKKLYDEIGDKTGLSLVYQNMGKALLEAGYFKEALKKFQKSLDISTKAGLKDYTINSYEGIFKCYAELGQYKNFNKYYNLFKQSRNTLSKKLKKAQIAELEAHYKIDSLLKRSRDLKAENSRKELKLKRYHILSITLVLVVILLILILFLYKRAKDETKKYKVKE